MIEEFRFPLPRGELCITLRHDVQVVVYSYMGGVEGEEVVDILSAFWAAHPGVRDYAPVTDVSGAENLLGWRGVNSIVAAWRRLMGMQERRRAAIVMRHRTFDDYIRYVELVVGDVDLEAFASLEGAVQWLCEGRTLEPERPDGPAPATP
ncbi:MAG: hypothetical protein JXR94_04135 [Candidatus Hydrogenedentes bacterium]|nr:hypothetical protein [Candidatus Hydrogenedentota bacterium]